MKKIIALVAILGLICAQAQSASIITRDGYSAYAYGFMKKNTVTSYTGPGDIVSGATAWYGLRGYNAAYSTGSNPAAIIRRASDNTTATINILSTGAFDTATATTFCASTTCYFTTMYDQTGNGNTLTQGTNANQRQLVFNCIGSLPCIYFDTNGSGGFLGTIASSLSQPYTMSAVSGPTAGTGGETDIITLGTSVNGLSAGIQYYTSNTFALYAGGRVTAAYTFANVPYAFQAVFNGSSSILNISGTEFTGLNPSTSATGTYIEWGVRTVQQAARHDMEIGIWSGAFSGTQRTNLCHNQYAYWGTSVSC